VIQRGCWFGAEVSEKNFYALVSCFVAPGFDFTVSQLVVSFSNMQFFLGNPNGSLSRPHNGDINGTSDTRHIPWIHLYSIGKTLNGDGDPNHRLGEINRVLQRHRVPLYYIF